MGDRQPTTSPNPHPHPPRTLTLSYPSPPPVTLTRWATANDFPVENIINDGTTSAASRMGSVADLDLVLRSKPSIAESDVMVVAGDMIFSNDFDISGVQRFFREKQGDVAVYYELSPQEQSSSRGIIEVDPRTSLVTSFYEKPAEGVTSSRFASVVFYMFRRTSLPLLATYLAAHPATEQRVFGSFLAWLVASPAPPAAEHRLYGMKLATAFELIGQSGLHEYRACVEGQQQSVRGGASLGASAASPITRRAHARVGLVGNPSDGFYGKTISVSIDNFWAEVAIHESDTVRPRYIGYGAPRATRAQAPIYIPVCVCIPCPIYTTCTCIHLP